MTKQSVSSNSVVAPDTTSDAGAPEPITPQMIEAGLRMYWHHLPYEAGKESHDRKKVVDIFNAMLRERES